MAVPALYVLNLHRRYTGVSATAAAVARAQAALLPLALVGRPLPGCPAPISLRHALRMAATPPPGRPFSIWHLRRNEEMRAGILARDILRLPVRLVFTSAAQRRHSFFPRLLIGRMDAVIATTPKAAGFVPGVRAVVPHGVDTERFHPAIDRDTAWAATGYPGERGIATIGRIRPEKGTDRFVAAMIEVLPRLPGVTALVIGRATAEHQAFLEGLKAQVAAAGLADRILFPGEISPEGMPALVRGLSLLVALPRYEGYGVTPLEAMASGVPFVACDAGHFADFAGEGAAGVILPSGQPGEAAEAVLAILSDPAHHRAMAKAARNRATSRFGVEAEAAAINAVYDQLWQAGGRP